MLSEELWSIHVALGNVLGKLDPDGADLVRRCCRNLDAVAVFAKLNKQELFAKGKSLDLGFGSIGLDWEPPEFHVVSPDA